MPEVHIWTETERKEEADLGTQRTMKIKGWNRIEIQTWKVWERRKGDRTAIKSFLSQHREENDLIQYPAGLAYQGRRGGLRNGLEGSWDWKSLIWFLLRNGAVAGQPGLKFVAESHADSDLDNGRAAFLYLCYLQSICFLKIILPLMLSPFAHLAIPGTSQVRDVIHLEGWNKFVAVWTRRHTNMVYGLQSSWLHIHQALCCITGY